MELLETSLESPDTSVVTAPAQPPLEWDPSLLRDELLHELFQHTADRSPAQIAIEFGDRQWTYGQVESAANALSAQLQSNGVRAGDRVALLLPRGAEVFVAMLAVLKSGAAYVPIDPDYPADRTAFIVQDSEARLLITTAERQAATPIDAVATLLLTDLPDLLKSAFAASRPLTRCQTGDVAYIIYTSGTTGQPKGVAIEHRSVCHLVRAESKLMDVKPADRVFQGFSVAFDASIEEIWLAFFAGATLVVGRADVVRDGARLADELEARRVTVLSTVPTLLAMLPRDLPYVRLLILGGEACPPDLVRRWAGPGRRVLNTYGPTEATVIATFADCYADEPVTIGRALPNYVVKLLDEALQPVARGAVGQICIGGIGVARGYIGRPELTAQKFVADPEEPSRRLYLTGDLGRLSPDDEIEFVGRNDDQVKLRGYRVELTEIESLLLRHESVQAAAVAIREHPAGVQQLVAYVVPSVGNSIDPDTLRKTLRRRLPGYMLPSLWETLSALPMLPSGKVDRNALPAPAPVVAAPSAGQSPHGAIEIELATAWAKLFQLPHVGRDADFFLDLGGHSLLATTVISELRRRPQFASLSVPDLYAFRTVAALAGELQSRAQWKQSRPKSIRTQQPTCSPEERDRRFRRFGGAQAALLYPLLGIASLQWILPFLVYAAATEADFGVIPSLLWALASVAAVNPLLLAMSVGAKWLVLGRIRAGRYPIFGWFHLRWWFVNQVMGLAPIDFLSGTPWLSIFYRLLGARIGKDVHLSTDNARAFDLLSIGDGSSIGEEVNLSGYVIEQDAIYVGRIHIGADCFIGARSGMAPGSRLEDGAAMWELSFLSTGGRVPAGQNWAGCPARPLASPPVDRRARDSRRTSRSTTFLQGVGALVMPAVYLAAIFPGVLLLHLLSQSLGGFWYVLFAPVVAGSFIVLMAGIITGAKWTLLGRLRPGILRVGSAAYVRKWFIDRLMDLSLELLGPVYATIFLPPWYRSLGAKLGKGTEISTACAAAPDLLDLGAETFVADCVSLGATRVDRGLVTLATTKVGRRAFLGNSAVVPAGSTVGEDALIGVLSTTPLSLPGAEQPDTSWLGSPAIFLPQRQQSTAFDPRTTFEPARHMIWIRAGVELLRAILPGTFIVVFTCLLLAGVGEIESYIGLAATLPLVPIVYVLLAIVMCGVSVFAKWLVVGQYRPAEKPLWSEFVWRNELVTALHENLANPLLIDKLVGTPFAAIFFRAMGATIGRRVCMETTQLTEYDLVRIGDDAVLNDECTLQTHLFEDRVMKMSDVQIGERCVVGPGAVVLYDTRIEDDAELGAMSLLMKGESLPAGTHWEGSPAGPAIEPPADDAEARRPGQLAVSGSRVAFEVVAAGGGLL